VQRRLYFFGYNTCDAPSAKMQMRYSVAVA